MDLRECLPEPLQDFFLLFGKVDRMFLKMGQIFESQLVAHDEPPLVTPLGDGGADSRDAQNLVGMFGSQNLDEPPFLSCANRTVEQAQRMGQDVVIDFFGFGFRFAKAQPDHFGIGQDNAMFGELVWFF